MPRLLAAFVVFAMAMVVGIACGGSTVAVPDAEPTSAMKLGPVENTPVENTDEAEALRQLAYAYWDAFNSYDAARTLGYLEDGYRQQRDETVRDEIQLVQTFGVKLEAGEHTPPYVVSENEREMYMNIKEPLGTRRIRMAFRQVDGEWKITHAEEPK